MKSWIFTLMGLLVTLHCQGQQRIQESIVVRAEITMDERTLDLTAYKRGQNLIRATIRDAEGRFGIDVIYKDGRIKTVERISEEERVQELSGEDAATHLLDLIALTPNYHFAKNDRFDLETPVFANYRLDYEYKEKQAGGSTLGKLSLIKKTDGIEILTREVNYVDMNEEHMVDTQEPRELELVNLSDGTIGRIVIKSIEYNAGVPVFLFSTPEL